MYEIIKTDNLIIRIHSEDFSWNSMVDYICKDYDVELGTVWVKHQYNDLHELCRDTKTVYNESYFTEWCKLANALHNLDSEFSKAITNDDDEAIERLNNEEMTFEFRGVKAHLWYCQALADNMQTLLEMGILGVTGEY